MRGKLTGRGKAKRADYYHKPNIPVAIVEAKDNQHRVGDGLQQAIVSRVERLLGTVAALEAEAQIQQTPAGALRQAVLAEVLGA